MSRRSSRNLTTVLKQTKPPNGRVTKRVKVEDVASDAKENIIKVEEKDSGAEEVKETRTDGQHHSAAGLHENLQDAVTHLCRVEPRFGPLFRRFIPKPWTEKAMAEPKNHFRSLVLGVMSQQVSGAAARSIGRKFVALFETEAQAGVTVNVDMDPEIEDGPEARVKIEPAETVVPVAMTDALPANSAPANDTLIDTFFPTAQQVAAAEVLYLKSAGFSLRKAEYVQGIAQAFVRGDLNDDFFATADDETIKKRLVSLRGLGPWSAEMFMMFSLNHWDILSPGDIGIQRGMSYFVGKDPKNKSTHNKNKAQKYMSEAEMLQATESWRPYRSIGCWMMWRIDGPDFNDAKAEDA